MKILLAILSAVSLLLGGLVFLLALAQLDDNLDAETNDRCTTPAPADGTTIQTCSGTEEGGGQTTLAVLGGSLVVTGGLLAVASVGVQRRTHQVAAPPAWSGQGH